MKEDQGPKTGKELKRNSYRVGYGKPPVQNQFKPKTSGNPSGRPARSKLQDIRRDIVASYLEEIAIEEGQRRRKVPAIVVLHKKLLRDALKGDKKAAQLVASFAREFGVNDYREKVNLDFSKLTKEESALVMKTWPILHKVRHGSKD